MPIPTQLYDLLRDMCITIIENNGNSSELIKRICTESSKTMTPGDSFAELLMCFEDSKKTEIKKP